MASFFHLKYIVNLLVEIFRIMHLYKFKVHEEI